MNSYEMQIASDANYAELLGSFEHGLLGHSFYHMYIFCFTVIYFLYNRLFKHSKSNRLHRSGELILLQKIFLSTSLLWGSLIFMY